MENICKKLRRLTKQSTNQPTNPPANSLLRK